MPNALRVITGLLAGLVAACPGGPAGTGPAGDAVTEPADHGPVVDRVGDGVADPFTDAVIDAASDRGRADREDRGDAPDGPPLLRSTDFAEADGDVTNPDRGFYRWDDREAPLVLVKVLLDGHCGTAVLNASVLTDLGQRLAGHRQAARRVILRFLYADDGQLNPCGLADAESLDLVLGHVDQLAPLLREHRDVIAYVEAGFFGMWGEWNSEYAPAGTSLWDDAGNRSQLLAALLAAVPAERSILVRRPRFRDELVMAGTAEGAAARIGFHDDCFLASDTDFGTYDGDRSVDGWKELIRDATTTVPIGGETCADVPEFTSCGNALAEMERLRFSYVHESYHPAVIERWAQEGCLDEVRRRLGHRLVLRAVEAPAELGAGGPLRVRLEVQNVGFAPPYSTRRPRLLLRQGGGEPAVMLEPREASGDADTRSWSPGPIHGFELVADLPADLAAGSWELRLLLLEDQSDAPGYALLLANDERVRDDARRENRLAVITVR